MTYVIHMISSFAEFLKRCKEEELQARAAKAERLRKVFTENNYDSGDSLVSALLQPCYLLKI